MLEPPPWTGEAALTTRLVAFCMDNRLDTSRVATIIQIVRQHCSYGLSYNQYREAIAQHLPQSLLLAYNRCIDEWLRKDGLHYKALMPELRVYAGQPLESSSPASAVSWRLASSTNFAVSTPATFPTTSPSSHSSFPESSYLPLPTASSTQGRNNPSRFGPFSSASSSPHVSSSHRYVPSAERMEEDVARALKEEEDADEEEDQGFFSPQSSSRSAGSSATNSGGTKPARREWTLEEDEIFLNCLRKYNLKFSQFTAELPRRTKAQIQAHYYYFVNALANPNRHKKVRVRGRAVDMFSKEAWLSQNEEYLQRLKAVIDDIQIQQDQKKSRSISATLRKPVEFSPRVSGPSATLQSFASTQPITLTSAPTSASSSAATTPALSSYLLYAASRESALPASSSSSSVSSPSSSFSTSANSSSTFSPAQQDAQQVPVSAAPHPPAQSFDGNGDHPP